jgi:hypothetical protein
MYEQVTVTGYFFERLALVPGMVLTEGDGDWSDTVTEYRPWEPPEQQMPVFQQ